MVGCDGAAAWLDERGQSCRWVIVGRDDLDVDHHFEEAYAVTARGATLIRADGFVVWRAATTGAFDENEIRTVATG